MAVRPAACLTHERRGQPKNKSVTSFPPAFYSRAPGKYSLASQIFMRAAGIHELSQILAHGCRHLSSTSTGAAGSPLQPEKKTSTVLQERPERTRHTTEWRLCGPERPGGGAGPGVSPPSRLSDTDTRGPSLGPGSHAPTWDWLMNLKAERGLCISTEGSVRGTSISSLCSGLCS